MGLDGVELVMKIEDTFQITMTDEEASSIRTVGDLHALVRKKIQLTPRAVCLSMHAFYCLRRALMDCTHAERKSLRASTPLEDVIPRTGRRAMIRRLGNTMRLRMPKFKRPRWTALMNTVLAIGLAVAIGLTVASPCAGAVVLIASGLLFYVLTIPFATEMHDVNTLGGLASRIRDLNFSSLAAATDGIHTQDVWETLVSTVADQLGVRRDELHPGTRFVEDLNVG